MQPIFSKCKNGIDGQRRLSKKAKVAAVILIAIFFACAGLIYFHSRQAPIEGSKAYEGHIGEFSVHMTLQRKGDYLEGWDYYDSQGSKLTLKGGRNGQYFYLEEFDENGVNTGVMEGAFLPDGTMEGRWRNPSGEESYEFLVLEKTVVGKTMGNNIFNPGKAMKVPWVGDSSEIISAEVNFSPDHTFTVTQNNDIKLGPNNPLVIYDGSTLVFETTRFLGGQGSFLTGARGNGQVDLVLIGIHGVSSNAGFITDFRIIGYKDKRIQVLDMDPEQLSEKGLGRLGHYYWPTIVDTSDRIGIEYSPQAYWTRYRVDIFWNSEKDMFQITEPVRISPPPDYPTSDNTAYLSFRSGQEVVGCFVDNEAVNELHIKVGQTLLLRRDFATDEELSIGLFNAFPDDIDKSLLKVDYRSGYFVLTGLKPGRTKAALQVSRYLWTRRVIEIFVDP